ncbi:MAG TPA: hypothetical protein DCL86_07785 [Bacteroidales bacterium]|nr:hypothetical protein [Bacteroidales bacterium]
MEEDILPVSYGNENSNSVLFRIVHFFAIQAKAPPLWLCRQTQRITNLKSLIFKTLRSPDSSSLNGILFLFHTRSGFNL